MTDESFQRDFHKNFESIPKDKLFFLFLPVLLLRAEGIDQQLSYYIRREVSGVLLHKLALFHSIVFIILRASRSRSVLVGLNYLRHAISRVFIPHLSIVTMMFVVTFFICKSSPVYKVKQ